MSTAFARLVWKDAVIAWPIVAVVGLAIIVLNGIAVSFAKLDPIEFGSSRVFAEVLWLLWVLLPGLLAFGMPAMLVGTEQESGTLNWLRSVAVQRRSVINSKLVVAAIAFAITWCLSSLVLNLVLQVVPPTSAPPGRYELDIPYVTSFYMTLQLLLVGFATSFLFRSPIAGLFAVLPTMLLLAAVDWLLYESFVDSQTSIARLTVLGVLGLLVLWGIQHWIAERRLRPARASHALSLLGDGARGLVSCSTIASESDYRVRLELRMPIPRFVHGPSILSGRPSLTRAMLWQAVSQQFPLGFALTGFGLLAIIALWGEFLDRSSFEQLVTLLVAISLGCLGSLVFYHDSIRRRHLFFGERGVSKTRVWSTRMAFPVFAAMTLAVTWHLLVVGRYSPNPILAFGPIVFACGALAAMWVSRPVLAFLVWPVLAGFMLFVMVRMMWGVYWAYYTWDWLAAVPVLFATWRLQRRWMNGERSFGFHWRCVAYLALGPLLLFAAIMAQRVATIPPAMPQWRTNTMEAAERIAIRSTPDLTTDLMERYHQAAGAVRNTPWIESRDSLIDFLKVSGEVRQAVVDGEINPMFIIQEVEQDEEVALSSLQRFSSEDAVAVVAALPADEIRQQSRRLAILAAWKDYQLQSWEMDGRVVSNSKRFAGKELPWAYYHLGFERTRVDRLIDVATKETLEYIARDIGDVDDDWYLSPVWREAVGHEFILTQGSPISVQADRVIRRLRERAARFSELGY